MTLLAVTESNMSRMLQVMLKDAGIILARAMKNFQTDLSMGKDVILGGIGEVTIGNGTSSISYQPAPTFNQKININQDKYFAIDLPDKMVKQSMAKLLPFLQKGANSLAFDIDQTLAALAATAQKSIGASAETGATELVPFLAEAAAFIKSNCQDSDKPFMDLFVGAYTAEVIKQLIVDKGTDNMATLQNGFIGRYNGFNVFESSAIKTTGTFGTDLVECNFACVTRNALGAVIQSDPTTEVIRRDASFADGLRGSSLYGVKNILEKQYVAIVIKPDLSD